MINVNKLYEYIIIFKYFFYNTTFIKFDKTNI